MPSLSCAYYEIKSNPEACFYYPVGFFPIPDRPWESIKNAEDFLKSYLEYGGKSAILRSTKDGTYLSLIEGRNMHTVSTYFLGAFLMEHVLRTRIKARDEYSQRTFLYSWFIACLSHDFGYLFEESDIYKQFVGKIETGGIDAFYNEFISSPPDGRIFKSYTYEQVDYYFRKRAKEFHCIDHGIVGGILLYTNLLKALEEWKCLTKVPGNSSLRYYHDRLFRIPMNPRKYFAEFADSIISHNIFIKKMNQWRANDQMEDLKHKPFSMKYKRLAFILGLADTLEPIKRFDYNPSCLDHISIEIKNNDRIVITCDENINTTNYFLGIKDMEGWLNVKVVACNRSITIILI